MMDRKEENKKPYYDYEQRLVIKILGKYENIVQAISDLHKIYPKERMNFSPILKNKDQDGYHCFVNILMDADSHA
jgi:hypothetical protein